MPLRQQVLTSNRQLARVQKISVNNKWEDNSQAAMMIGQPKVEDDRHLHAPLDHRPTSWLQMSAERRRRLKQSSPSSEGQQAITISIGQQHRLANEDASYKNFHTKHSPAREIDAKVNCSNELISQSTQEPTSSAMTNAASEQVRWSLDRRTRRQAQLDLKCHKLSYPETSCCPNKKMKRLPTPRSSLSPIQANCFSSNKLASELVLIFLSAILLFSSLLPSSASSYQLTNSLIANNSPPKFVTTSPGQSSNSEIVVRVKEGPGSVGKLIYTLKGEDPDEDPVTFGVLGSMASELLRVENVPGNQANVYLRKELDRETTESHQVVITLTDGKLGRGNWVEDVNDNYPLFGPHRTSISIREDAKVPLIVETLEATDQDEGRFGQVIYKLEELDENTASTAGNNRASHSANKFSIETVDGKGVISLISPLDYEQRALYQLRVSAIDRAIEHERLSATTSILISVEDCEDQPPMFTFVPSITRLPEDTPIGSQVVRVSAIDGDRGVNNAIQYKLLTVNGLERGYERNLFALDADSGQVTVAQQLDRESGSDELASARSSSGKYNAASQPGSYVLQIRATELDSSGSGTGKDNSVTTELTIILTDVNDETPKFSQSAYYGEVLENSPPESLVTFIGGTSVGGDSRQPLPVAKVVDRDQGTNGTFTLHLEGEHSQLFEIWPREATNEANFIIKISNSGGSNAQIYRWLDYELNKQFQFTIVAREKLSPVSGSSQESLRSSSAMMTVFLKDSNDNYPQFESELYRVEVPENAIRGMHICAVKATDADSGALGSQGIRYTEIRGEKANKFKLDPLTGFVTLKTSEHEFDRESIPQHHLIIEARDNNGSGNRNTTQLLIVLTDVNDQRPKFLLDQYESYIYENELDFQSPLQVQAVDGDAPNSQNSRLSYSIVGGDPQQNFTIDPQTGRIRVRSSLVAGGQRQLISTRENQRQYANLNPGESDIVLDSTTDQQVAQVAGLDFERIAQKRDETRQFNLTIKATDSGLPEPLWGTTQVLVVVYDKNDHAPVFTRSVYSKSIREDAKEGSQVIQVLAHDGDHSPTNSKITYRISSGASDKFVIDSDSGLITVANGANLDINRVAGGQRRTNYLLNVIAFDGSFGPNQKSSSALVNISVIDVNNKAPEFISLGASRSAPSSLQLSGHQQQQLMVVYVSEDAPFGLIVTRVVATDLDSSAELRYSIDYARSEARNEDLSLVDPGAYKDLFSIEPSDGTIKVARQLDRELFDQVKLSLQVEDVAAQTADQIAQSFLLVRITDVNDNRPTFRRAIYKTVVNENSISGTSVITLTADDRDVNKTLRYSLEGEPEMMRLIRINPKSGEVTVNDKIDRELYPLINVTVRAEDYGFPHSLTGTAQLLITVRDENDNNPIFINGTLAATRRSDFEYSSDRFDQVGGRNAKPLSAPRNHHVNETGPLDGPSYRLRSLARSALADPAGPEQDLVLLSPGASARVREDAPINHKIAYVRAEDADVGNNGRVIYLMDAASSGDKFRIDRDTGIISVASPLDRELTRQYTLIIEACDNYDLGYSTGESRRAFTHVNILVTDINDNPPVITTNLQTSGVPTSGGSGHESAINVAAAGLYPTYEEARQSPGPFQMPLAECLFINEFQPLHEPIITITAIDADDPSTSNGQVDLAIINNSPQSEFFSLVTVAPAQSGPTTTSSATTATTITNSNSAATDLSGFGDLTIGESAATVSVAQPPIVSSAEDATPMDESEPEKSRQSTDRPKHTNSRFRRQASQLTGIRRSRGYLSLTTESPTTGYVVSSATMSSLLTPRSGQPAAITSDATSGERQAYIVVSQSLKEHVGNYSIMVRATDRGQPALSTVKLVNICVQDVNNHAPVFTRPPLNHTIRIMENATIGSQVTQVEATDADQGANGDLHYSLKATNIQSNNNDWQAFKIDKLTGVITTKKQFNRMIKKYYTLRVQAQDLGKPTSLSSDIDINIMIVSSGQYQPEFESQTQNLQFTENVAPGVEWYTLSQTTNLDDDPALINVNVDIQQPSSSHKASSQNWLASPCYFIVDGDDYEQVFHLDRYTHRLTNQRVIDREKKANYTLIVQATNNCNSGSPISRNLPDPARQPAAPDATTTSTSSSLAIDYRGAASDESSAHLAAHSPSQRKFHQRVARSADNQLGTVAANATTESAALVADPAGELNAASADAMLVGDKSLLKVIIKIKDINDNAPKFTQKVYTGGITTEADFGTVFMIVQAMDADADANGLVSYNIIKPIKRNLMIGAGDQLLSAKASPIRQRRSARGDSLSPSTITTLRPQFEQPIGADSNGVYTTGNDIPDGDDLFVIHPQTGEISLNFDPQKHMKGYFEFDIIANDTDGLFDKSKVFIYLLRQDQRVKFVLRLTPHELRQRLNKFRSVFGNITGAIVNIDSYKYYENHDGTVDKKKTSLYLHFVNPENNTIIEVDKVLTLIDNNIEYLDELYKEFHVLSSEAAHLPLSSGALVDPIDQIRTGLLGVSSFLALILVLVIALCLNQRTRYERQLKAATVSAFGTSPLHLNPDFHSQTNLPNTNLHSQDPNPIWVNGFSEQNWLGGKSGAPASSGNRSQQHQDHLNHHNHHSQHDDLDHLSSESSDLSSLGGGVNGQQHHYNGAPTATPRDSLSSSHGQVSTSGSGASSTTNERQILCGRSGRQTPAKVRAEVHQPLVSANRQQVIDQIASSGKQNRVDKMQRAPFAASDNQQQQVGAISSQVNAAAYGARSIGRSTFGSFKEVTIYTDVQHQRQAPAPPMANYNNSNHNSHKQAQQQHPTAVNLIRNQQQPTSQVNKIASQFNAKHLNTQLMSEHQGIIVHANGADPSQGIVHTTSVGVRPPQQQQQGKLNRGILINGNSRATQPSKEQSHQLPGANATGNSAAGGEDPNEAVKNFEQGLIQMSIMNLETTEL